MVQSGGRSTARPTSLWARVLRTVDLVRVLAPRELKVRYRQSFLDLAWVLIGPVAVLAVYGYVLTQSFDVTAACSPYLVSAWAGLVVWTFMASAVAAAVGSLIASAGLVTKLYFPKEAIPLSVVVAASVELLVGMATLVVLCIVQGVALTPVALLVVLPLLVVIVWTVAISILVAVWAAFVRDVVHAVGLVLRVGFFFTPVMYEPSFLPSSLAWTAQWNPIAVGIDGVRSTMLCGAAPELVPTMAQLTAGTALMVVALLYTRSIESRLTDVV